MFPTPDIMSDHEFVSTIYGNSKGFIKRWDEPVYTEEYRVIGVGAEEDIYVDYKLYVYIQLSTVEDGSRVPPGTGDYTATTLKKEIDFLAFPFSNIVYNMIVDSDEYKAFLEGNNTSTAIRDNVLTGLIAKQRTDQIIEDGIAKAIKEIDTAIENAIKTGEYAIYYLTTCRLIKSIGQIYKDRGFYVVIKPQQARMWLHWDEESLSKLKTMEAK